MGKVKFYITLCSLLLVFKLAATKDSTEPFKLLKTITGSYTNFNVDNMGNVFLISPSNQIKKLNSNFDSVGVFNDIRKYGNISYIDVSNPLKILVYYKDFATVLVLDRFLNTRNIIDLRKQNIFQVNAICLSYDNNIWLFDELDSRIKKIDETGKIISQTADFRLLFEEIHNPSQMIDADGWLYTYNAKQGWLVFDYYGGLKKTFPFSGWKDVQVKDKLLAGRDSTAIVSSPADKGNVLSTGVTEKKTLLLESTLKMQLYNNNCYLLKTDGLYIYMAQ